MSRITTHAATPAHVRLATTLALVALALVLSMLQPARAQALTQIAPEQGKHFEYLNIRPMVTFDLAEGETPKWVLLATDAEMKTTVRYCRMWTIAPDATGTHWGCNTWAIGTDWLGMDIPKPLEWGKTYYWNIAYTDKAGTELNSPTRAFTIDEEPAAVDINALSDKIFGSVVSDGSTLNTGASAFVNSGLKVASLASKRVKPNRFRIDVTFQGDVNLAGSYVTLRGPSGKRVLKLQRTGKNSAKAVFKRTTAETKIRDARFTYQAHLKSVKNGALVRSEARVILMRSKRR